jgi:hypothetical protein
MTDDKMKIIFLDNDGVICLSNNWGGRMKKWAKYRSANPDSSKYVNDAPVDIRFDDFDKKSIKILNEILNETGAEIVVSSDWRFHASLEEMQELFKTRGVKKSPIGYTRSDLDYDLAKDITPVCELEATRSLEILSWLEDNPQVTHWVAVDDLDLGKRDTWGLTNFVHTPRSNEGIKQSGVKDKILNFLK